MSGLFKPVENTAAFLKMGILGFAGSGKTYTSWLVARGLHLAAERKQMPYAGRPIYFIDTEGGASYLADEAQSAGVDLQVAQTRAYSDLVQAIQLAEKEASVLIIDSITHFWLEFQEAYKAKKRRSRITIQDWGTIKQMWRKQFTEPFLNSQLHIIMCGRAVFEYDHFTDDDGKKQMEKSGVKMSAERELGFEPSLLIMMERHQDPETFKVTRKATVQKDRFRVLDGAEIHDPTFKDFAPHIGKLNWGGKHKAVDAGRSSEAMIEADKRDDRSTDRAIILELIDNLAKKHFGTSQADKKARLELYEAAFGTSSDTALARRLSLEDLQSGYDRMHIQLEGRPSPFDTDRSADADDEIPHLEAAE